MLEDYSFIHTYTDGIRDLGAADCQGLSAAFDGISHIRVVLILSFIKIITNRRLSRK